eukprot:TRINITY_DN75953_c0_g1_i1.p1 TRINITY_DN75953_c0_g1~~TRINITY_DN75953_c0_g1_i1.p1  ORF type:complete len:731 (-),score=98.44 TRINITY_DN75953_c0_g1_i1:312-2504(-)
MPFLLFTYFRAYVVLIVSIIVVADSIALLKDIAGLSWKEARKKAAHVVSQMTDAELLQLVRGSHFKGGWPGPEPGYFTGSVDPIPRLGIPALKMADAGNGFRPTDPGEDGTTTCWPSLLALASTWDSQTVMDVAAAIGAEFVGKGANVILGPSVNVHRVARNGRNFEYLSGEDPHLGAVLTSAYVLGVQSRGVMAVAKHFAFNEQETDRHSENSEVDDRVAWELYYPPFQAAVDAGVGAVMASYNLVNGTHATESAALLQRDLKNKMGFEGFVMSDWLATYSADAISNGLDQEMPGTLPPGAPFNVSFTNESLSQPQRRPHMKEAATRILSSVYRIGLDKRPGCIPPHCVERATDQTSQSHRALARKAAIQALVMLKNDGILPLNASRARKLLVLGQAAFSTKYYAGGGSGQVPPKSPKTPYEFIRDRGSAMGMSVSMPRDLGDARGLQQAVLDSDVVLVVGGAFAGEGEDRTSLSLDAYDDDLIMFAASERPTVVMLMSPGAVATPWRDNASAILNLFFGGEQAGAAAAAVIFGDASPLGKLPISFPASEADQINPGKDAVPYSERLFTSYRSPTLQAAYAFGHGLSYSRFEFSTPKRLTSSDTRCTSAGLRTCIALSVRNVGGRHGSEVVQAYLELFAGRGAMLAALNASEALSAEAAEAAATPARMLRGFRRTRDLAPGEAQEVVLPFSKKDFSIYRVGIGWIEPDGKKRIHIGASSVDIRHVVEDA